jgi:hypothetical protein
VALLGLLSRLLTTGALVGATTLQREFESNCIEGCQGTGAPHGSCRSVCACLVQDLAAGKTPQELDRMISALSLDAKDGGPFGAALEASRQRCVARLAAP